MTDFSCNLFLHQTPNLQLPLQALVDLHVFADAQKVVADLRQHDCTAALAWCEQNRGRLKKGKNPLEFRLRMQVGFHPRPQLHLWSHMHIAVKVYTTVTSQVIL